MNRKSTNLIIHDENDSVDAPLIPPPKPQYSTKYHWLFFSKPLILLVFLIGFVSGNLTAIRWNKQTNHPTINLPIHSNVQSIVPISQEIDQTISQFVDQSTNLSSQQINQIIKQWLPMVNYIEPSKPNDFTIVIPSYHGHLTHLVKYLMTMKRYCVECTRLPIILVVGNNEKPMFTERVTNNPGVGPHFANITIVTLPEITTLPYHKQINQTGYWEHRKCDDSHAQNACIRSKFVHQSLKKMYGCLSASTRFCWSTDSEGLFVRPITVKPLLQDFIDDPYIMTHTWTRFNDRNDSVHSVLRETMGIHSRFGRLLEYYLWVFDRSILAEVERIIKNNIPTLDDFGAGWWMFIEVHYYAHILHNQRRFPQYRIVDMPDLYDPRWLDELLKHDFALGPVEGARTIWERAPQFQQGINEMWRRFGLKAHRCSGDPNVCTKFLDANPGVAVLLSDQPQGLFEQAMLGRFVLKNHSQDFQTT